jgi:diaminohydroxyphosphoribosylaminopyrimidine deaminase/5-amino-6-(5-phosphoribosylamino)uracil reductase
MQFRSDIDVMQHALRMAKAGEGYVEPNPMVGAVIVNAQRTLIAEGFHERFGASHAEINAIRNAGERTRGADLFVTLEPCCHHGKTPPCSEAVIAAGFRRVVLGCSDPAPHVAGGGIRQLREAGVDVTVGVCEAESRRMIAPFAKLMTRQIPWIHSKWAMTLDGRIAANSGHSKWISSERSRAWVHELRGRMDAILTGSGTVIADDPLLTARGNGPRKALRVVVDSSGRSVTANSNLAATAADVPVLVCVSQQCSAETEAGLQRWGVEVLRTSGPEWVDLTEVLQELGRRQFTNVLLEAGSALNGAFFDQRLLDEVHVFISPKLVGGQQALSPIGGSGLDQIPAESLHNVRVSSLGGDVLIEADLGCA